MLKSSAVLRMVVIAGLIILLLIPTLFVVNLVDERSKRKDEAVKEISANWGGVQTLNGPILTIPYKEILTVKYAHFLPAKVNIEGEIIPELRYRGIYEVPLYTSDISVKGFFKKPDFSKFGISEDKTDKILWQNAFITFGITDLKGVKDTISMQWNNSNYASSPGVINDDVVKSGITFKINLDKASNSNTFNFNLKLNGATELRFVPVGEITETKINSKWGNPSFIGQFLPTLREIKQDKFFAEWKVLNLNRNFPQEWMGNKYNLDASTFGVSVYMPVDEYQKNSRSVKYAILFIILTFAAFFISELITKQCFHPIQYSLIGFALILFYVLLLSLSEHIGFNLAYIISSFATILLVTVYTKWISIKNKMAIVAATLLFVLYLYLFVTLQLQDYALLLGSIGLFIALAVVMYVTRKIDWFAGSSEE